MKNSYLNFIDFCIESIHNRHMIKFRFNEEKAKILKEARDINLNKVADLLERGEKLALIDHPTRDNQVVFVMDYKGYTIAVPCVEEGQDQYFIKTAWQDRKLNKRYKED